MFVAKFPLASSLIESRSNPDEIETESNDRHGCRKDFGGTEFQLPSAVVTEVRDHRPPTIELREQRRPGLAEAEIASPTEQVAAKFADHAIQGRASVAFGNLANSFLELAFDCGAIAILRCRVNVNPRNLRFQGRSTALLS